MKRTITGVGVWTDDEGGKRNAVVALAVEPGAATVSVGGLDEPLKDLPAPDRKTAHFLGQVEAEIRAIDYANRPITSYLKSRLPSRR